MTPEKLHDDLKMRYEQLKFLCNNDYELNAHQLSVMNDVHCYLMTATAQVAKAISCLEGK